MYLNTIRTFVIYVVAHAILLIPPAAQAAPSLDPAFAPVLSRPGGHVSAMAVQADGKIIIAGGFNAIGGKARLGLARLNSDGALDAGFDPGAAACCGGIGNLRGDLTAPITAVAVQLDGKIVIAGHFTTVLGVPRQGVARLHANGTLDAGFDPGAGLAFTAARSVPSVSFVIVQPDGKILLGGRFVSVQGVGRNGVARLNGNGSLDTGFDPGVGVAIDTGESITSGALLPSGKLLIAGSFAAFNETVRSSMARLNPDGSLDASFDPQVFQVDRDRGMQSISGFAVQPDGRIVISGTFDLIDFSVFWELGRLRADGTLDNTFTGSVDVPGGESFTVMAAQSDGKILGVHAFNDAGGSRRTIARLNADGKLDASFVALGLEPGEAGRQRIASLLPLSGGTILAGGHFSASGDASRHGIARIQSGGGLDAAFRPRLELSEAGAAQVQSLAVQRDGKALIGGTFTLVNGVARDRFVRLQRDGTLDTAFAPAIGVDDATGSVSAIKIQGDGKILIGGTFRTVQGAARNGLARLNEDGSLDATFQVGAGTNEKNLTGFDQIGRVNVIAVETNGFVWIGGEFLVYNGVKIPYVARLTPSGGLDPGFNMGFRLCDTCDTPSIRVMAPLSDGTMLVGGRIDRIGVGISPNLVKVLIDGNVDPGFNSQLANGDEVFAFAQNMDGAAVAAVALAGDGGGFRGRLIKFNADGTPGTDFKPDLVASANAGSVPVSALALDAAGVTTLGGALASVGASPRRGLARVTPSGTLDAEFQIQAGFDGGLFEPFSTLPSVLAGIGLQDDGGIVVAGSFATIGGVVRFGVARFQGEPSGPGGGGPRLLSPVLEADGSFSFLLAGEAGRSYRIEVSSDLSAWSVAGTVAGQAQPGPFRDAVRAGPSGRYYRAIVLP